MPHPTRIWAAPVYLPYVQPELTDEVLHQAESKLGLKLPESYVALLKEQNGGYIRKTLLDTVHDCIWGIGPYFPSILDSENAGQHARGLVPFDGDGHWYIALDYRDNASEPKVILKDDGTNHIANSFAEYLQKLELPELDTDEVFENYTIETATDTSELAKQVAEAIGTKVEDQGSNAHGYPVYLVCASPAGHPRWIWFSPNQVSSGFIREDDDRYLELHNRMPGETLRFPELPPSSVLIQVTRMAKGKFSQTCEELGLEVHLLRDQLSKLG